MGPLTVCPTSLPGLRALPNKFLGNRMQFSKILSNFSAQLPLAVIKTALHCLHLNKTCGQFHKGLKFILKVICILTSHYALAVKIDTHLRSILAVCAIGPGARFVKAVSKSWVIYWFLLT